MRMDKCMKLKKIFMLEIIVQGCNCRSQSSWICVFSQEKRFPVSSNLAKLNFYL